MSRHVAVVFPISNQERQNILRGVIWNPSKEYNVYTYNFDDAVGDEINNNMHIHSGIVVGCPRTMNGFEQHNLVG
jgi:hypothetical protein